MYQFTEYSRKCGTVNAHPSKVYVALTCRQVVSVTYLSVLGALGVVSGVEHLEAAHVTHVAVEIGTIDSIAALSNSSVWAELLPQLFI